MEPHFPIHHFGYPAVSFQGCKIAMTWKTHAQSIFEDERKDVGFWDRGISSLAGQDWYVDMDKKRHDEIGRIFYTPKV